jgi:phage FluMu gp28-like protein
MSQARLNIAEIAKDRKLDADGVYGILLDFQKKWIADKNPYKCAWKGRRTGFTFGAAAGKSLKASANRGCNVYYQAFEKDMTRQFIIDCANWSKAWNFVASEIVEDELVFRDGNEERAIHVYRLFYNSGFLIEAMTSNPNALRSKQGDVVLDECAFMKDFPGCLKAARAMPIRGDTVEMISTPNGVAEPYYNLLENIKKGKHNYSIHQCTFDDAINQGLYHQICYSMGWTWTQKAQDEWRQQIIDDAGEDADEELFCIANASGGTYFSRILVERCMEDSIPVFNLTLKDDFPLQSAEARTSHMNDWLEEVGLPEQLSQLQPNYRTSFGFDFGRSGDLSYLIVLQELPNLVRKTAFALEMRNVPFTEQEQVLFFICDRLPRFIGGALDSRGNGQALAERTADRYGRHRVEQVMLSQPWYSEHMPKYKAALEDQKIVLPDSSDLLSDHRSIENIRGVPKPVDTKNKDTKGLQRHSDGAVACALGFYASCFDNESAQPAIGSFVFENWELGNAS